MVKVKTNKPKFAKKDSKSQTKSANPNHNVVKKTSFQRKNKNLLRIIKNTFVGVFTGIKASIKDYQSRRPHRSFRHTSKSLQQRPLEIEGCFKFSRMVLGQIWRERKFFGTMLVVALLSGVFLIGVISQTSYNNLKSALDNTYKGGDGVSDTFFKSGLLLLSAAGGGGFNLVDSEGKQLLTSFLFMAIWLAVVWYLRHRLAGRKVSFRDSIYNGCAPIIATLLVMVYMLLQMVPLIIMLIFYLAAVNSSFISEGVELMALHGAMILVVSLTIYWLEGSFLALVVATIPGIYPMQAIKIAGDLVVGRRLRILYRMLWHVLQVLGVWILTALPITVLYNKLSENLSWLQSIPLIPVMVMVWTLGSMLWTYSYVYMLYRRIITDESAPA